MKHEHEVNGTHLMTPKHFESSASVLDTLTIHGAVGVAVRRSLFYTPVVFAKLCFISPQNIFSVALWGLKAFSGKRHAGNDVQLELPLW